MNNEQTNDIISSSMYALEEISYYYKVGNTKNRKIMINIIRTIANNLEIIEDNKTKPTSDKKKEVSVTDNKFLSDLGISL
jgi:hypothetical protein